MNKNLQNTVLKFKTFLLYVITFCLGYAVVTLNLHFFPSVIISMLAFYVFFQALDNTDKLNNIGQYNPNKNPKNNNHHNHYDDDDDEYHHHNKYQEPTVDEEEEEEEMDEQPTVDDDDVFMQD